MLGVVLRGFVVGKREREQGRRERGRERNQNFLHVLRDMGQWKMRDNLVYGPTMWPYFLQFGLGTNEWESLYISCVIVLLL